MLTFANLRLTFVSSSSLQTLCLTCAVDDAAEDGVTLEEKEENGKELHNNELRGEALECSQSVSNLEIANR